MNTIPIYTARHSERLAFICHFIFSTQWGLQMGLTNDKEAFEKYEGPKINYSEENFTSSVFTLKPVELLFENDIRPQPIECFQWKEQKAFYKTNQSDFEFDIFAAAFYLISRYEEWLPHEKDMYGRYAHENALSFREGFLDFPWVDYWVAEFHLSFKEKFPALPEPSKLFRFQPSYDIDMAWSFKNKGLLRNLGGMLKTRSWKRLPVLLRIQPDPYDCYAYLDSLHEKYNLKPIYFLLLSVSRTVYDKNINPYSLPMWRFMKRLAKPYELGIHPSWRSYGQEKIIQKEKKILETATKKEIQKSRQHYIRFSFPDTFENLIASGIKEDYSMGYGSINGFRASTAMPFPWFNLKTNNTTELMIHPFCFMDANCFYEQKLNLAESKKELEYYLAICKTFQLPLITIFHNDFLGTDSGFSGWREIYESFIAQVPQ